jgi:hypothetical protein
MLIFCSIVAAILKMATGRNFSLLGIKSGHHYLPTYQILMISGNVDLLPPIFNHCPISTPFHMLVDYDIPKGFLTSKNFYRSPFSKWPPQYRKNSTLFVFKGSF